MKLIYAKRNKDEFNISLYGVVGESTFDGTAIAKEIEFINQFYPEATKINLRINSEGGSVINGIRVISAILNSDIPICTYNDGYAMSMAGVIWLSAKKENRFMNDFAINMIHAPYLVDDEGNPVNVENEDEQAFINAVYNQLLGLLVSSTGKDETEMKKILSKDSFYDAKESIKAGFVFKQNVIKYKNKPENLGKDIKDNIRKIAAFYREINNVNNMNMDINWSKITGMFNLLPSSNEDAVAQAVEKERKEKATIQNKLDAVSKEIEALKTSVNEKDENIKQLEKQVADFKEAEKKTKKDSATALVDKAIADGKLKKPANDEEKEKLVKIAEDTPEVFNAMTEAVNTVVNAPDITAGLQGGEREKIAAALGIEAKDMNFWTLWEKNEKVLNRIKAEYPVLYKELEKEAEKTV